MEAFRSDHFGILTNMAISYANGHIGNGPLVGINPQKVILCIYNKIKVSVFNFTAHKFSSLCNYVFLD